MVYNKIIQGVEYHVNFTEEKQTNTCKGEKKMKKSKKWIAALLAAALCLTPITGQTKSVGFAPVTASAESISDMPQDYRNACDWIWQNRIETEKSCEAWATIYDQIIAGNGTLNYILMWQSYEPITLAQRQRLPEMLENAVNQWTDNLIGYDEWPFTHVNVNVVGYAVLDESCLLDRQPDEVVYTDTADSWLRDDMISSGMGDASVPAIQPAEPISLSRYAHWQDKNWSYNGDYNNRYDMYLHGITGMINMGGYGYHYGQILSDQSVLGLINGTTSEHILLHEMGHGFGFPDYYGGEGESDGFPPGGFPGGENSIMMAGSCGYINTFDKWFLKYTWSKLKAEPGRFDLAAVTPETEDPVTPTEPDISYRIAGDVNADGVFGTLDLVTVQKWLVNARDAYLADWEAGDVVPDGMIDAFDLAKLKHMLLTPETPAPQGRMLPSVVEQFGTATPSTGDVKMLNVYVDFADAKYLDTAYSTDEIREELYGNGKTAAPYESVAAWYERASYGNLHVDGDVYHYTCKGNMADYSQGEYQYETMVMEVLEGLDGQINYQDYDGNHDGVIDCIAFTVPLDNASDAMKKYWYGCTSTWYQNPGFTVDNMQIVSYIIMDVMPNADDMTYLKQTLIHEMGHSIGLPDYYKYGNDDYEGLHGEAGFERMDDSIGDFCSFSKLMYGWLNDRQVQTYSGSGEQTFRLADASREGSCLVLPITGAEGDFTSEYFLIEAISLTGNNADMYTYDSGVRIFHVQAEVNGTAFKYDNFSEYYMGDDKIRVLRLVNDGGGFYHTGDTIGFGTSNFAAYDASGDQTIDTGYTVHIGAASDGGYTVTVTRAN